VGVLTDFQHPSGGHGDAASDSAVSLFCHPERSGAAWAHWSGATGLAPAGPQGDRGGDQQSKDLKYPAGSRAEPQQRAASTDAPLENPRKMEVLRLRP
jgi:hypothetical protein